MINPEKKSGGSSIMHHILVCDDEEDIVAALKIYLESDGYCVHTACCGADALKIAKEEPVQLALLDIMMPELSGIEASKEIRRISSAPILFLTARTQEQDKLEAYQSGGDDYLAKPFSHGELLMKVDSLIRRYRVYKGKVAGKQLKSDVVLDEENRRILRGGEALELTETEFSILQFLADHRGSVVSVAQIYEGVWHEKYMPASNNTVMVHIVNLRKKLEDDPANPRLIRTIWGKGYQID